MRNRLKVSPTYEVKLGDVAQLAGDAAVVQSLQDEVIYKITARDKTHVVIDVMKIIEIIRRKTADFFRTCMVVTFHWSSSCHHIFS